MSEERAIDLLGDLAKLLKKYGPGPFEELAQLLANPAFSTRLALILAATARAVPSEQTQHHSGTGPFRSGGAVRSYLDELWTTEPKRAVLLRNCYERLQVAPLGSARALKDFAAQSGLPEPQATTKYKAVLELLGSVRDYSEEQLEKLLAAMPPVPVDEDRSLAAWTRLILDKERRSPQTGT